MHQGDPRARRCRQPADSDASGHPWPIRPDLASVLAESALGPDSVDAAVEVRFSLHGEIVVQGKTLRHIPDADRTSSDSRNASCPGRLPAPMGRSSPSSMRMVVVLPEPFGPR